MAEINRLSYRCTFALVILAQLLVGDVTGSRKSSGLWNKDITERSKRMFEGSSEEKTIYRLPQTAEPVAYRLNVGIVEIDVVVKKSTRKIILHSRNLTISKFYLTNFGETRKVNSVTQNVDPERDILIFKRSIGVFELGTYTLTIEYSGQLRDDFLGFFVSFYKNIEGKTRWYAGSSFSPIYARTAFPCFDEPSLKAKFKISITHHKDYFARSNTPKIRTSEPDVHGMVTTIFDETPRMSTYLVAIFVSQFESISNKEGNFSVLAKPNVIGKGRSALQKGEMILEELETYTGIPYSEYMKKMDLVAVDDLHIFAADNWGLVMYRDYSILLDENDPVQSADIEAMVGTIAEELAYQWFGNLVTPKWWTDMWWNAGIAAFLRTYILAKIEPKWRAIENFVIDNGFEGALEMDSCDSQALNHSPEPIEPFYPEIFHFPLLKGAAIIRMMQHFLTDSVFRRGLQNYLNKNKETSADSDDVFQLIDQAIEANATSTPANNPDTLIKIMDGWVNYPGYPLLTVTRNYTDNTFHIVQEGFLPDGVRPQTGNCMKTWYIPINFATTNNLDFSQTTAQIWLTNTSARISVDASAADWILLNKQATGYYRVNYDETNWMLIINYLKASRENIHVLNRAQLMNDAFALMKADKLGLSILLELILAWENETDYIAWIPAYNSIWWLEQGLRSTEYHTTLKDYVERINKTMDVNLNKLIRNRKGENLAGIFRPAQTFIYFDHKDCSGDHDLRSLFHLIVNKTSQLSPMTPMISCCDYRDAEDDEFDRIQGRVSQNSFNHHEPEKTLCLREPESLQSYLNLTERSDSQPRIADGSLISGISIGPEIKFIISRLDKILGNELNRPLDHEEYVIHSVAYEIATEAQIKELKEMNRLAKGEQKTWTSRILVAVEERKQWLEKNKQTLIDWTEKINRAATKRL